MKPRILITARSGMNGKNPCWQVNKNYVEAIKRAGGIPIICSPQSGDDIDVVADLCEGLLITGGNDVEPSLYGEFKGDTCEVEEPGVDDMDLKLIKYFYRFHKPILGICRGIQIINVAFGGTLYQDLPTQYSGCREEGHADTEHLCYFEKGTYGEQVFGPSFIVNSYHHQAIKALGDHLEVSGVSEDRVVEAIQARDLFAVQWHPERMCDVEEHFQLFTDFVDMCKGRM